MPESIRRYELRQRHTQHTTPPISTHDTLLEAMRAAHEHVGLDKMRPLFTVRGNGVWTSIQYIINRVTDDEGTPPSDYANLAEEILHTRSPKPPSTEEVLYDILSRIRALCENPHWDTSRKTRIAELATKGLNILEGE